MLAEISIPDMYSLRSMLCVGAIPVVIFLLIPFGKGKIAGSGWNATIFIIACLWLSECDKTGMMEVRAMNDAGQTIPYHMLMGKTTISGGNYIAGYDISKKYWAMHCPDASCTYISPWIWHPACIVWWSGLFGLPVILTSIFVGNVIRK